MGIPWNEDGHERGVHRGYPDAPEALGGDAGRPDLVELLSQVNDWRHAAPEEARPRRNFRVYNARLIQDAHMEAGGTLESFFAEHGYALVHAPTKVTDFMDANQTMPGGVYPEEVEEIARRLLPSRNVARIDHMSQNGHASPQVFPEGGSAPMAHQDTGFSPRDWCDNFMAYNQDVPAYTDWIDEYQQWMAGARAPGFEGQLQLNIWRPRKMNDHPAPLTSMPLAMLDGAHIRP